MYGGSNQQRSLPTPTSLTKQALATLRSRPDSTKRSSVGGPLGGEVAAASSGGAGAGGGRTTARGAAVSATANGDGPVDDSTGVSVGLPGPAQAVTIHLGTVANGGRTIAARAALVLTLTAVALSVILPVRRWVVWPCSGCYYCWSGWYGQRRRDHRGESRG